MLKADYVDLTPDEVLELGMREMRKEQARFAAAARDIDPNSPPVDVYRLIHASTQPPPGGYRGSQERRTHPAFLIDHKIVTIPSEVLRSPKRCPHSAATSFASMSTPPIVRRACLLSTSTSRSMALYIGGTCWAHGAKHPPDGCHLFGFLTR